MINAATARIIAQAEPKEDGLAPLARTTHGMWRCTHNGLTSVQQGHPRGRALPKTSPILSTLPSFWRTPPDRQQQLLHEASHSQERLRSTALLQLSEKWSWKPPANPSLWDTAQ